MIYAPTNRRIIRPYDKPSFEHTQRYGLIKGHWANVNRVGLWLFNEGSGNKAYDLSGNNNIGTFGAGAASPSWTSGINFDGGDTIDCGTKSSVMPDAWTVIAGVKPNAAGTWMPLIGWASGEVHFPAVLLEGFGGGKPVIYLGGENYRYFPASSFTLLSNGDSHVVAFTCPGSAQTDILSSKMFIDGIDQGTDGTDSSAGGQTAKSQCWIGYNNDKYLTGSVEFLYIFNPPLFPSEIALLYRKPFLGIKREAAPVYFFVPTGGVVYQELNLTVTADASAAEIDTHAMVDTGKAVQAVASATESDTQQMVETGKEVSADASVSCTDLKVVFELNLTVTADGSVVATEAHTMIETGKNVTAVASPAVLDTQAMVETELDVSAEGSVSCTDTMGLLAHIAAFMILRQCTT